MVEVDGKMPSQAPESSDPPSKNNILKTRISEHYIGPKVFDCGQDDFGLFDLDDLEIGLQEAIDEEMQEEAEYAAHSNQLVFHSGQFDKFVGNSCVYIHKNAVE